ncbi:rod shape-determining protein MreD [Avibacterium endocarditidis]|uniref:Rod shape-determining protein MreD n=1 Tax=Avibacterium gallinarum TaxID=755 RepID=A0A379AYP7_AVIGA|nr:rod shape-determining protein MreD [Avibacterium gallinarum]POY43583.1 rod shape-determining protein MreD [Avibacterium gallinarum]TDP28339.1 rod shape-determining protein MreD [Avibacterium gallinarum]SUB27137.1 rod shape-determining protein MreD [Avibacterium gallinarum]
MRGRAVLQLLFIVSTFLIAMVLEIAPWPTSLHNFKPAWLLLVLTYWILAMPSKISVGTAFLMGIAWDLVLGSTLGIHALVLSVFAYLLAVNSVLIWNLSLWMQGIFVILAVFGVRIGIFIVELFLHSAVFNWQEIFGAITTGVLWPWIFLLLRKVAKQFHIG